MLAAQSDWHARAVLLSTGEKRSKWEQHMIDMLAAQSDALGPSPANLLMLPSLLNVWRWRTTQGKFTGTDAADFPHWGAETLR